MSVVIVNHNYERYVGAAIESALAITGCDIEVIVVDDGSTDASPSVIGQFDGQVTSLFPGKCGQLEVTNLGLSRATGDVVVFLDSDDVLPPNLGTELAQHWGPAVSKAQFRMQRIGPDDELIGTPFPRWRRLPSAADVRRWAERTTAYPTPPGSGNAYAKWYLERIFPLQSDFGHAPDSACLAAAPFHGDVITVPEVVVGYRRHGANLSNLLADRSRLPKQVRRARDRWLFALESAGLPADERPLRRSRELLQFRVGAWRVARNLGDLPAESWPRLVLDAIRSPVHPGPEPIAQRIAILAWSLAVLCAPRPVLPSLLRMRYGR